MSVDLYYHANVFFCFGGKTRLLITRELFENAFRCGKTKVFNSLGLNMADV